MMQTSLKTILITILVFITAFNSLYSKMPIMPYSMRHENLLRAAIEEIGIDKPVIVNFMTTSTVVLNFHSPLLSDYDCYYSFDWDENNPRSTFWFVTYTDFITQNNVATGTMIRDANSLAFYRMQSDSYQILNTSQFNIGLSFSAKDTLEIDTIAVRFGEFITTIKQDEDLFKKLEFATTDTVNQYFAFGIGYIATLDFDDASNYEIDKSRPICFVVTASRTKNEWDFCYSYADEPIEELTCISNYSFVAEQLILSQVYPNPTNERTTISLELEAAGDVKIVLSDVLGQELLQIYDGFATAGTFSKTFTTENLSRGVYFLKILSGKNFTVEKIVVN